MACRFDSAYKSDSRLYGWISCLPGWWMVIGGTMREIKFRAWDCHTNKWVYFKGIFNVNPWHEVQNERGWNSPEWHEMKWESQFTGLENKDGKEIYERDIILIKWKDKGGNPQKKRSVVEWNDAYAGYGNIFRHSDYEIYIIGNIYENPTLLEEGK